METPEELNDEARHWAMRNWVKTDSSALDLTWYQPPAEAELRERDDVLTNRRRRFHYARLRQSTTDLKAA